MGKLIKCHWARLILMAAAACQIAASISGYFWPKIFFDFITRDLDIAVRPFPYLQTFNLVSGIVIYALEWPLQIFSGSAVHRSIEVRLILLPLTILSSAMMYQSTNPAIFYTVGLIVYFWAYSSGEIVPAQPWKLPPRPSERISV